MSSRPFAVHVLSVPRPGVSLQITNGTLCSWPSSQLAEKYPTHAHCGTSAGQPVPVVGARQRKPSAPARSVAALFQQYEVVLAPVMPTTAFPHDTARPMTDQVLDFDGTSIPHLIAMAWCGAIGSVLLPVVTLPIGPTQQGCLWASR